MGGKSKKPITVGYRYFWDIHSGLGRGPIDEVVEVRVDDKTAYSTVSGEITRTKAIKIDKPNLFGGEDTGGEGGVVGRMEFLMGEPDQKPSLALYNLLNDIKNPEWGPSSAPGWLRKLREQRNAQIPEIHQYDVDFETVPTKTDHEALIPGFRGVVTTFFSGMISAFSAYPKKHSYRVRRTHKGWKDGTVWYPEKCKIILRNDEANLPGLTEAQEEQARQIHAMNPAHILVECATNLSWGGKKDITELDIDSFKKAADTLFDEGFGLCFRYNRQNSIKQFIQEILDHIGAVQYDNAETGKLAIKLIRQDYNSNDLPLFTYDNGILKVQDDDTASSDNSSNQVIVTYLDPVLNKEGQAIANNLASIRTHGVLSKKVSYKGVPTFDLAVRVAQRDLEMTASGLVRLKLVMDMRASDLKPGDVFKIHLPERSIESAVMRVGKLENGNEGQIIVTCIQDVFGLPATNYSSRASRSLYTPPDYSAKPITAHKVFELPYHVFPLLFSDSELAFVKSTDCYIGAVASKPSGLTVGLTLGIDAGAGFGGFSEGTFTPSIILTTPVTKYQTSFNFKFDGEYIDLANAVALMIDDEIVKIESVDLENNTLVVGRGCADTIPQHHDANSRAWCYLLDFVESPTKYTAGEELDIKLLSRTTQEEQAIDSVDAISFITQQRQGRPYPPANVKLNEQYIDVIENAKMFTISWSHRDRDLQADKLLAHTEASTSLAEDVSYKITLLLNKEVVREISLTGDSFSYPDKDFVEGEVFDEVKLNSDKGNLSSLFSYAFKVGG